MITENEIYSLIHYEYGLPYSGEYKGMRYRIARTPMERVFGKKDKGEATLEAVVWKGPFSYDATKEEKISVEFPFTEEGRIQVVKWLNEQYEGSVSMWDDGKVSNIFK
jgi:hypothetical protein